MVITWTQRKTQAQKQTNNNNKNDNNKINVAKNTRDINKTTCRRTDFLMQTWKIRITYIYVHFVTVFAPPPPQLLPTLPDPLPPVDTSDATMPTEAIKDSKYPAQAPDCRI